MMNSLGKFVGSFFHGWLGKRIGPTWTLVLSVVYFVGACIAAAIFFTVPFSYWWLLIGLVFGISDGA
jgi:MFS family permease